MDVSQAASRERGDTSAGDAGLKALMDVLAASPRSEIEACAEVLGPLPQAQPVRGPETGLVMLRGRIGGDGGPFNLGEAVVTRATVRLACGSVGHAYALGQDKAKARLSALLAMSKYTVHSRNYDLSILRSFLSSFCLFVTIG